MRELEFKRALADEMATVQAPPMISETEMLTAGRRARQRRRAAWASAGSAAAVVVLATAVAFTASNDNRSDPDTGASTTDPAPTSKRGGGWTETAGPRYDLGVALLDTLVELVPPGLAAPPDLTYVQPGREGAPLRDHQAAANLQPEPADDQWYYFAVVPVTNANGIGMLHVTVYTPPSEWPDARGCELSVSGWRAERSAGCQEVMVAGTSIGVATQKPPADGTPVPVTKWAGYRHSDGTVVFLEQASGFPGANQAWMNQLPLTDQQLAELVTDSRFDLD